jgi:hypothetical protein
MIGRLSIDKHINWYSLIKWNRKTGFTAPAPSDPVMKTDSQTGGL